MTKEKAQQFLEESRKRFYGERTCPLSGKLCDQRNPPYCQAYEEGVVYAISENDFRYRSAACLSLAVSCYVEMASI